MTGELLVNIEFLADNTGHRLHDTSLPFRRHLFRMALCYGMKRDAMGSYGDAVLVSSCRLPTMNPSSHLGK